MTKQEYFLLKLIASVPNIVGRKKLQKLVYLIKFAGVPFESSYTWHYYGPYSADLALQIDTLVNKGFLDEMFSIGYTYRITDEGKNLLQRIEENTANRSVVGFLSPWTREFSSLAQFRVSDLEKASSVLFWMDWGKASKEAIRTTEIQKGKLTTCAINITKKVKNLKTADSPIEPESNL